MAGSSLCDNAEIVMGQSPPGDTCNTTGSGLPLLNGPTEYGPHHPIPVQFTKDSRKLAQKGDVLFCVRGSTTDRMNWSDREYAIGRGVAAIRHRTTPELQPFVRAVIEYGLPGLLAQATGSTFPNVSADQLAGLWWPPFGESEQRAIAHILGTLDDKIEMNRRMNETLEAMAQAEFGRMKDEGGRMKAVPLPNVIEVNPPRALRKGTVAPYLDMANMPTRSVRAVEVYDREFGSGMRFMDGDTLVARITPCLENGKTCFVDFLGTGKVGWGSTEYIVLRPKPPLPPEVAYFLARTEGFRSFAISNMTGTSGRQRVPADCLVNFLVAIPPTNLVERFGKFARTAMEKMKANDEESRTLAVLRDALLPKLLSGEMCIPHIL